MGLSTPSPTTSPNVEEIEKRHRETILELKKEHSIQIQKVQESMQENYDYLLQSIPTPPQPTWQCPGRHCPGCPGCTSTDDLPRAPDGPDEEPPWQYGEDDWYEYGYWDDDGYWYWNDDEEYEWPTESSKEDFTAWWTIHQVGPP